MKKLLSLIISCALILSLAPAVFAAEEEDTHVIVLSSAEEDGSWTHSAVVDGEEAEEFDYVWHADPSEAHSDVKNSPAEYYTGEEPDTDAAVYISHDIYYYPELDVSGFTRVRYDDEQEWAYYYTAEGYTDMIFATLPVQGDEVPASMMHSEEEAYGNAVLYITQPGTYEISGEWHGQIRIDLGDEDETFSDENAKVTLILNGVSVDCSVAPALVFFSAYECDDTWEDKAQYSAEVDTSAAGANIVIADGSVNSMSGANVFRMLKTKLKDDDEQVEGSVPLQKKARKLDGAVYSYVSMNIGGGEEGSGVLNIYSEYEGLGSELHLSVNGGNVNIFSQDDGINVNEDDVSVLTVNGGSLHILAGLGREGDGIDSNGWVVVNGGTLISMAKPASDSGIDSEKGTYIYGGTVVALGSTMDYASSGDDAAGGQAAMNLRFSGYQSADEAIIVTDTEGNVVFAYDPDKDEVAGANVRTYSGAIVSAPGIETGKEYYVYIGGNVEGSETEGVYDVSTVTGFSEEARQQCYTGTDDLGGRFRFGGPQGGQRPEGGQGQMRPEGFGGQRPEGMEPPEGFSGERPELPEGAEGQMPEGMEPPEGFDGERPELPEGFDPAQGWTGNGDTDLSGANTVFAMEKKVNSFSGVSDWDPEAAQSAGRPQAPAEGRPQAPDEGQPQTPPEGGSPAETAAAELPFSDVSESDWFFADVSYAFANGLMDGTSADTFSPKKAATRAMIVTMLWRLEGEPGISAEEGQSFTDVAEGSYYEKAVAWAAANGIVDGYGDGTFRPGRDITREQLAAIMYRYAQYKGFDLTAEGELSSYEDSGEISAYAKEALSWANGSGLITGHDEKTLDPRGTTLRSQAAAVFHRFMEQNRSEGTLKTE